MKTEVDLRNKSSALGWKSLDILIFSALIAGIIFFILYPIFSITLKSFFENGAFTLKFYRDLFSDKNAILIKNSLWVATFSSVLTTFFALCIALYLFTAKGKKYSVVRSGLLLTMISPPFVSSLAFIMLFGRRGLITYGLLGLSVNPYGKYGIVILQTIGNISFAALMLSSFIEAIDYRQILASRDLGATPRETLFHVILPSAKSGILSILFLLFTMNLADFSTPIVIGGRFQVLATEAYLEAISTPNLGKAAAISVLMIPSALVAFWFYNKTLKGISASSGGTSLQGRGHYAFEYSTGVKTFLSFIVALFFFVMLMIYSNILLSTFTNTSSGTLKFTTKYFQDLPRSQWNSFKRSFVFAIIAGAVSSVLGIVLSYYTQRRKIPGMQIAEFSASLPYVIPGTFFGLGYVAAFSSPPTMLRGTSYIIIFNYIFRQISLPNKGANAAFSAIDQNQDRASQDLGSSKIQTFMQVLFPQLLPTFFTSFISIFTSSMTAVGAVAFLISPGKNLASMELFQSIENGRYGLASVQAVCIILITVAVNLFSMFIMNRVVKKEGG